MTDYNKECEKNTPIKMSATKKHLYFIHMLCIMFSVAFF